MKSDILDAFRIFAGQSIKPELTSGRWTSIKDHFLLLSVCGGNSFLGVKPNFLNNRTGCASGKNKDLIQPRNVDYQYSSITIMQ